MGWPKHMFDLPDGYRELERDARLAAEMGQEFPREDEFERWVAETRPDPADHPDEGPRGDELPF